MPNHIGGQENQIELGNEEIQLELELLDGNVSDVREPNVISNEEDLIMEQQEDGNADPVEQVMPLGALNLNVDEARQCQTEHKMSAIQRAVKEKHRRRRAGNQGMESLFGATVKATRSVFQ